MNIPKNQPHGSILPIKFSPYVSRPNRGRVPTKSCTTTKPSRAPIRVVQNQYPSRGLMNRRARARPSRRHERHGPDTRTRPCRCPSTRPCTRSCIRSTRTVGRGDARHAHSARHTPEHSAVHALDTRTRPCIRPTRALGRTVLPKSPWTFCAPHSHI